MAKIIKSVRGRKYTFIMKEDSYGHKGEINCPVCRVLLPVSRFATQKEAVNELESELAFHLQIDHPSY